MKLKSGFGLFAFLVFTIILGGFGQNSYAKTIELSFSNLFPPTHIQGKLGQEYCDVIEERTGGKVKIVYYPGGSLVSASKTYSGVVDGITDIGISVLGYSRGVFPALEAVDLPFGYKSGTQATKIVNAFVEKFKPKELNKVKVLALHAHGPGFIHSQKPIRKLEDFKGVKTRCFGFNVKVVEALGGVPVAMSQSQAYEALQKGVCEANLAPIEVLKGWKQAEVIKYTTETYSTGYTASFFFFMNKDRWNALPKDIQAVFEKTNKEWIPKFGAAWDSSDNEGRKYTLEKGNEIITLSDEELARWSAAVEPVISEWTKAAAKKGLPAQEYIDFLKEAVKTY